MQYSSAQTNRLGNRASNQDRCLLLTRDNAVLLVVADGMGGHARGDLAAQACIDTLSRQFRANPDIQDAGQFLREAFAAAHQLIDRVGQTQKPPIAPLTTVVACLIQDGIAQWAHVGDSRVYLIRGGQVLLRTRDHSRVADMVESGLLTEQQARLHPLRNQVSLCLGGRPQAPNATLGAPIGLQRGDILLLCSDGLWSAIPEKRLTDMLGHPQLARGLESLAEAAEQASYPQSDNISGVAIRWVSNNTAGQTQNTAVDIAATAGPDDPVELAIASIHQALADYQDEMPDTK